MCGIAGLFDCRAVASTALVGTVSRMIATLDHRGPDDSGTWIDESVGLALGHRRLSILDLSSAGHQPMQSDCGRYTIVFNGEIYNHLKLREQLKAERVAPVWRGHADTESLLACFVAWGIEKTLQSIGGMFAFALWDRKERKLTLARDRMGEKPLYYGFAADDFLFASELKALRCHPKWQGSVDRSGLGLLLRYNYIPAPHTIYKGISKLDAGCYLTVRSGGEPEVTRYWSAEQVAFDGARKMRFEGDPEDAVQSLESKLMQSLSGQMLSDVSLGAFLSGGVDSSTVVALMQASSSRPIKTFTIGFDVQGFDEAADASRVARHLGTEHTEHYVTGREALEVVPQLPTIYDEPFADVSQIPTYLVSRLASSSVTVALSGDGGDELFGGYNRYTQGKRLWELLQRLPRVGRGSLEAVLNVMSPKQWDSLFAFIAPLLPKSKRIGSLGDKIQKITSLLSCPDAKSYYQDVVSFWREPEAVVVGSEYVETLVLTPDRWPKLDGISSTMMYLDMVTYMPDDILVKMDRAAMSVGLEGRMPLLDHRLVEFAWSLPLEMKIKDGVGKWPLREVLYKYVPRELIERPKMGFGVPLDSWLRGPLREWAEDLLDEQRLINEGYFDADPIRMMWQEHISGKANRQHQLWSVLMFQAWLENQ
ncbi:asparagine synthase (glutamine-hydrolyzing) [Solemya pervernicosa gill symbiont]|uniref:asparagine synthase (glutamine-hydrolyzing) n=2 Tax=Gammaproteobacteria incertae sedis TaxID=118884 RepID=A0A1T2L5L9_9GAMM|nr:asparagine synthase (glutamine-hydrolyzing) [Candidatus Reidiella endopervernicosa]OOZ40371.1 asparagine synthase (glutamine-hydrolyzing) [Solemya pervernicosa gill symbiont]QKQ25583.1 asparagine synthase (glutamine-hydrolyzing) [Candidatus Reidiella endopervernicosa]